VLALIILRVIVFRGLYSKLDSLFLKSSENFDFRTVLLFEISLQAEIKINRNADKKRNDFIISRTFLLLYKLLLNEKSALDYKACMVHSVFGLHLCSLH